MADLASVTQLLWLWRTIPSLQQGAPMFTSESMVAPPSRRQP